MINRKVFLLPQIFLDASLISFYLIYVPAKFNLLPINDEDITDCVNIFIQTFNNAPWNETPIQKIFIKNADSLN